MTAQALNELSAEDLCLGDLLCYSRALWPGMEISRHHRLMADALMDLERRQINRLARWFVRWPNGKRVKRGERLDRLMLNTPPRHSKTMLAGSNFASWYLGRNPAHSIIYGTYNQERADDVGRVIRNIVLSPEHWAVFRQCLAADSRSVRRFAVDQVWEPGQVERGELFAIGRGGPATGRGAHLLLLDDVYKDREEAASDAIRRQLRNWWSSSLYTRQMPDFAVLAIMTRWAEDDLCGWLLSEYASDGWLVINLPALIEDLDQLRQDPLGRKPGEALWPDRYGRKLLQRIKSTILPVDWQSMYQGRPSAVEGSIIQSKWIRWYDDTELPKHLRMIAASDYGVKADEGADRTEHGVAGIDHKGHLWLVDWWGGQTEADFWVERQLDLAQARNPHFWIGEGGVIRHATEPLLKRRMQERRVNIRMHWMNPVHDKPTRARAIAALFYQGRVHLPRGKPWARDLANQLLRFPNDRTHDDMVDVMSLFGRAIDEMRDAVIPPKQELPLKPFSAKWLEYEEKPRARKNRY